jgi:hypothetical protein
VPVVSPLTTQAHRQEFHLPDAGGGARLLSATMATITWATKPWAGADQDFWHTELGLDSAA